MSFFNFRTYTVHGVASKDLVSADPNVYIKMHICNSKGECCTTNPYGGFETINAFYSKYMVTENDPCQHLKIDRNINSPRFLGLVQLEHRGPEQLGFLSHFLVFGYAGSIKLTCQGGYYNNSVTDLVCWRQVK